MHVDGGYGDDVVKIYGGSGTNSLTYDVSAGSDVVTILGGSRRNTLTINKNLQNITLQSHQGKVLFQSGSGGTIITVANLNRITVIGDAGKIIYTYNAAKVSAAIVPLLLR